LRRILIRLEGHVKLLKSGLIGLVLLTVAGSLGLAQQAMFNFDTDAQGTPTPFTDIDAVTGLTAAFTGNLDPAGFLVDFQGGPTFATTFAGMDLNQHQDNGIYDFGTLTITFSQLVNNFSVNFVLNDQTGTANPFNLIASAGGTQVGSATTNGQIPVNSPAGYEEGLLTFGASPFDSITLSSPDINLFAIDNVSVDVTAQSVVPEPGTTSLLLLGAGCVFFGIWRRSRSQALCATIKSPRSSIV
jgi:hypothetical protein